MTDNQWRATIGMGCLAVGTFAPHPWSGLVWMLIGLGWLVMAAGD